jgi:Zn-dependent protease with chaperone function
MIGFALVPLMIGVCAAVAAPRIGGRIAPAIATILLTGLALTVSLATGLLFCLAAYVAVGELLPLPQFRAWSIDELRDNIPVPPAVGLLLGAIATVLLGRALVHLLRVIANSRRLSVAAAALPAVGELAIIDDATPHAYAVPGRNRRVVVSTGMLRSLSAAERRALLAHEAAHLRCHHHLYVQLARLAAAANPLMRPVSRAVDSCVERWADAAAARAVGGGATVARAVSAAALAPVVSTGVLAVARNDVVERVRILLDPPARRPQIGAALVVGTVLCWASVAVVLLHTHNLIELAQAARR